VGVICAVIDIRISVTDKSAYQKKVFASKDKAAGDIFIALNSVRLVIAYRYADLRWIKK